ncbi:Pentatricopeptide repeat-containing protein [Nymphaea thermarum]|nr:Pentatricopeptide repeat-containing protein [Nymphaea thermarum]
MESSVAMLNLRSQTPTLPGLERTQPLTFKIPNPNFSFTKKVPPSKSEERCSFVEHQLVQLSNQGKLKEAVGLLDSELRGRKIKRSTYISMLQACIDVNSMSEGRKIHAHINSVVDFEPDPYIGTKLVSMFSRCDDLKEARRVFDEMSQRNIFTWSAIIGGYAREGLWAPVTELFARMIQEGITTDAFLLPKVLQACGNLGLLRMGRTIHSMAIRMGFDGLLHVYNSLMAMYWKSGELNTARRLFDQMPLRDCVSWNTMISGYCAFNQNEEALKLFYQMQVEGIEPIPMTWNILIAGYNQVGNCDFALELLQRMKSHGCNPDVYTWTAMISGYSQNNRENEALSLFVEMLLAGIKPNGLTVTSALSVCADMKNLRRGMEIHSVGVKLGWATNLLVANALIDTYAKCGKLESARVVFDAVPERDIFTWNSMIAGYAQAGFCGKAHDLFCQIESSGIRRNTVTWNIMISGYMKSGDEEQALELFQEMETRDGVNRNTSSWNAIIAGSVQNGHSDKALQIFRQMLSLSVRPNQVTMLSILPAYANLLGAKKVRELHAYLFHVGLDSEAAIANSLIDTYSKSGNISCARIIFDRMLFRDIISWNSMIAGHVLHGQAKSAKALFDRVMSVGVTPDNITYTSMILTYGLLGVVTAGVELFSSIYEDSPSMPAQEHFSPMVFLFGRSGRVREAMEFIENMDLAPNSAVWNTLFTACRIHGNITLAVYAMEKLNELEHGNLTNLKILEQLYILEGRSEEASKLRKPVSTNRVMETLGYSCIEVNNLVYQFFTGDRPTPCFKSMDAKVDNFAQESKMTRHDSGFRGLHIYEEEGEDAVGIHSEKLAIAFSLINNDSSQPIRVVKNLRVCLDCHNYVKLISRVYGQEILLKDTSSLHHFKDGTCSCGDFW